MQGCALKGTARCAGAAEWTDGKTDGKTDRAPLPAALPLSLAACAAPAAARGRGEFL